MSFEPVRTLADLEILDDVEILAGYLEAKEMRLAPTRERAADDSDPTSKGPGLQARKAGLSPTRWTTSTENIPRMKRTRNLRLRI